MGSEMCIRDRVIGVENKDVSGDDNRGAAYVFEKNGAGMWVEVQKLTASNSAAGDFFGSSIGISDNDKIVIGANGQSGQGAIYFFEKNAGGTWDEVQDM